MLQQDAAYIRNVVAVLIATGQGFRGPQAGITGPSPNFTGLLIYLTSSALHDFHMRKRDENFITILLCSYHNILHVGRVVSLIIICFVMKKPTSLACKACNHTLKFNKSGPGLSCTTALYGISTGSAAQMKSYSINPPPPLPL